jgi:hypothetical protein
LHELDKLIDNPDNEVYILSCDGILKNCFVNTTSDRLYCRMCRFVKKVGEKPYRNKVTSFAIEDWVNGNEDSFPVFDYKSVDDIKRIVYKGCYIGYGALSSYVSYTRNQEPIMDQHFRKYFDDLIFSQVQLVNAMENLFQKIKFAEVFLYNGRWADVRPVYDICKRERIKVNVLESVNNGTTSFDREIYVDALPQDIEYRNEIINRIWDESKLNIVDKEKLASDFYIKRKKAEFVRSDIKIFTSEQQTGKLPENWDSSKINISIFNSSEDEFVALGMEWEKYRIYPDQESGLNEIMALFENVEGYHFYLRIHPNLTNVTYGYHRRLLELGKKYRNMTIIPADSKVSTYTLIEHSEKVIVFGSSVGVEACFFRKPVILLGGTIYYFQDVAYIPSSTLELKELIMTRLEPKPILGALKFGFYLSNHDLYTETISSEPYSIKIFGKTLGYGFSYMRLMNSALLFKIVNKILLLFHSALRAIIKDKNKVPAKGY